VKAGHNGQDNVFYQRWWMFWSTREWEKKEDCSGLIVIGAGRSGQSRRTVVALCRGEKVGSRQGTEHVPACQKTNGPSTDGGRSNQLPEDNRGVRQFQELQVRKWHGSEEALGCASSQGCPTVDMDD
jgi:hypothetical protein